jgi:hypothetical protein
MVNCPFWRGERTLCKDGLHPIVNLPTGTMLALQAKAIPIEFASGANGQPFQAHGVGQRNAHGRQRRCQHSRNPVDVEKWCLHQQSNVNLE